MQKHGNASRTFRYSTISSPFLLVAILRSPVLHSHPKQRWETFAVRSFCYADSKVVKTGDSIFLTGRKTNVSEVQSLHSMMSRIAIEVLEMMTSSITSLST